ncbi:MAG: hypothetical protein J2P31_20200, partial [Blastocatellia bacterium]|nr:hypothetical protein [Blastocatellia bacterium]
MICENPFYLLHLCSILINRKLFAFFSHIRFVMARERRNEQLALKREEVAMRGVEPAIEPLEPSEMKSDALGRAKSGDQ